MARQPDHSDAILASLDRRRRGSTRRIPTMTAPDLICYAQALVDENRYLTLGDKRCAVTRSAPGVGAIAPDGV
jgi:hypothetical protein